MPLFDIEYIKNSRPIDIVIMAINS